MRTFLCFLLAVLLIFVWSPSSASTLETLDVNGYTLYASTSDSMCSSGTPGDVIRIDCWGGPGQFLSPQDELSTSGRLAFLSVDVSPLVGTAFDSVYLSLTEVRTGSIYLGTSNVYIADNDLPLEWPPGSDNASIFAALQALDATLAAGTSLVGTLSGTGVGGNQVLLDVTSAVENSLLSGLGSIGFLLADEINDGLNTGFLGSNYDSGRPPCPVSETGEEVCQYYATSEYEYPSLFVTDGGGVTPINDLRPRRPIAPPPLIPPPHTEVPEPSANILMGIGLIGIVYARRRGAA